MFNNHSFQNSIVYIQEVKTLDTVFYICNFTSLFKNIQNRGIHFFSRSFMLKFFLDSFALIVFFFLFYIFTIPGSIVLLYENLNE